MKKKILHTAICLLIITNILHAQGGRIDSSFGVNGYAVANPLAGDATDYATCQVMGLTRKGNIILAGQSIKTGTSFYAESIVKPGNYMLVIQTASKKETIKFIKQ